MSDNAKTVFQGLALSLLVLLPFAVKLIQDRPPVQETASIAPDDIAALIAQDQYKEAYALLQADQSQESDLWKRQKRGFQLAVCERVLDKPAPAYARLHAIDPVHPELEEYRRFWMAHTLAEMGEGSTAISAYRDLLLATDHPGLLDSIYLHLPQLYIDADNHSAALDLYHQSVDRSPTWQPALLYRIAQAYDALGQATKARQQRINLINRFPGHRQALKALSQVGRLKTADEVYAGTQVYFHNNQRAQAIKALKSFISAYPKHQNIEVTYYLLAQTYSLDKQYDQAEKTFAHVHKTYRKPSALYRIGGIQVRRNRDIESIKTYELFVRLYPQHELAPRALWQAAKAAERHNQFDQARQLYNRLVSKYPRSDQGEEAGWSVGFMHYCQAHYKQALETFRQHSRSARSPHLIDQSFFWAAKTAAHLKLVDEAQSLYRRTASNFPRSYYAARAVGMGHESPPLNAPARQATPANNANAAIQGTPFIRRATLFDELGLDRLARGELKIAEGLNSDNQQALEVIREAYETLGFWDRSLTLAVKLTNQRTPTDDLHHLYPDYYWQPVSNAAAAASVDPHLVLSVIRQESFFNHNAVSPAGAIGLMQIMPQTGRTIASQLGQNGFKQRQLFDPSVSIRFGSFFLGEQLRAFSADPKPYLGYELGLAAYNAGPHKARSWLKRFPYDDPDVFIERIPYKETRLYIKKVLKNYTIYKTLAQQSKA
jgi:soluble lytic murein transglycosylase